MCEHHMLPFFGYAHIGYIPSGSIAGASKLARVLDVASSRLQLQERLTDQVADALFEVLQPDGVAVVVEAEHLCMIMRGVRKLGSKVVTSSVKGRFVSGHATREELLSMVAPRD
jgi:GTP cyclohydrolase I